VVLQGCVSGNARAGDGREPLDPSAKIAYATPYVKAAPAQQAELEALPRDQQDHASPSFRAWLWPAQFAARFGLSQGDVAKNAAWLEAQGPRVENIACGRRWIAFTGSAANRIAEPREEVRFRTGAACANPRQPAQILFRWSSPGSGVYNVGKRGNELEFPLKSKTGFEAGR